MHRSPPEIRCADCGFRNANGTKGVPETGLLSEFDRKSALAAAVMSTQALFPGNFRLKCAPDRRMVQTTAPLGWPNL
ncbi:MAG: hypothetical protein DMG78_04510 [Acidobacteria bacterium]|nr:MAG: hypothetical protein DMG78_04510 [Acidobacteriota bacterium]